MKRDTMRECIIQILCDNGESGWEKMVEEAGEEEADRVYEVLEKLPELQSIDHLCQTMSGEGANPRAETLNICALLSVQSERLIEIGQEEDQDGLLFAASQLESIAVAVVASLQYHDERRKDSRP